MDSQKLYPPLRRQHGRDKFRLLVLEPGEDGDPIVCQLRIESLPTSGSLEDTPLYDAVSHVWGCKDATFLIRVGAWMVPVRENLSCFLKEIRSSEEPLTLWIDALSINQANLEERAYQVHFMDRIYHQARRALVWLGTEDDSGLLAMDLIAQIAKDPSITVHLTTLDHSALSCWARRPYWTRTWVVQEFLLARDVLFIFGSKRLAWSTVSRFIHHIQFGLCEDLAWSDFIKSPAYVLLHQRAMNGTVHAPLARLLVWSQDTECDDPRDKVYAMLGLAVQPDHGGKIQPSYKLSVLRLLCNVLEYCRITAVDMIRYVRFLSILLQIDPDMMLSSPLDSRSTVSCASWRLTGFSTGKIIRCATYHEQFGPSGSLREDSLDSHHSLGELRGYSVADVSRMLKDLEQLSLMRLRSIYNVFKSRSNLRQVSETETLVTVLCSECEIPEILLGIAVGNVRAGDTVTYFLGHHVGIVTTAEELGEDPTKVAGVVVCAQVDEYRNMHDAVTRLTSKYWTIQNEGDLRQPMSRVCFRLRQHELLTLAQ